jgi:hypothetical protein
VTWARRHRPAYGRPRRAGDAPRGAVAGAGGVAAQSGDGTATATPTADGNATVGATENGTDDGPPNGTAAARLTGTVGVTEAAVERRAFGLAVARAASNDSGVGVVSDQFDETEERAALDEAYAAGSVTNAAYRARMAAPVARTSRPTVWRRTASTRRRSGG